MKKIKFTLFPLLCVALMGFSSCSDDDMKVEETFENALKAKYPDATRVEWEKKREYTVADCLIAGKDTDVWFASDATWKMTETDLLVNDLPSAVTAAFDASEYAAWRIDDIDLLEYPSAASEYVIEVEKGAVEMELFYSPSGELLKEEDVSNTDATHWPK